MNNYCPCPLSQIVSTMRTEPLMEMATPGNILKFTISHLISAINYRNSRMPLHGLLNLGVVNALPNQFFSSIILPHYLVNH